MSLQILDEHHVARYCNFRNLDEVTGEPMATAFMLRPEINETELSVNWIEYFGNINFAEGVDQIRESITRKLGGKARFAVLNVGDAKTRVKDESSDRSEIDFKHDPDTSNVSHSKINGLNHDPAKNQEVAVILAQCVIETFRAKA